MKKVIKSVICCLAVMLLALPVAFLAGCGKNETAKAVKNRNYYIKVAKNGDENYAYVLDGGLKISFADDLFKVEIGEEGKANHGVYLGSFKTDKTHVYFTVDPDSVTGVFATSDEAKQFIFDSDRKALKFEDSKLKLDFTYNSNIIRLVFERKTEK